MWANDCVKRPCWLDFFFLAPFFIAVNSRKVIDLAGISMDASLNSCSYADRWVSEQVRRLNLCLSEWGMMLGKGESKTPKSLSQKLCLFNEWRKMWQKLDTKSYCSRANIWLGCVKRMLRGETKSNYANCKIYLALFYIKPRELCCFLLFFGAKYRSALQLTNKMSFFCVWIYNVHRSPHWRHSGSAVLLLLLATSSMAAKFTRFGWLKSADGEWQLWGNLNSCDVFPHGRHSGSAALCLLPSSSTSLRLCCDDYFWCFDYQAQSDSSQLEIRT